jgi:hypothetical protein
LMASSGVDNFSELLKNDEFILKKCSICNPVCHKSAYRLSSYGLFYFLLNFIAQSFNLLMVTYGSFESIWCS